jgi:hypothetical protein
VLNRALAKLPGLIKRNGLSVTSSMADAHKSFIEHTNPVGIWLDRATIDEGEIPCNKLLAAYNAHTKTTGLRDLTKTAFGSAVRGARPGIELKQRTVEGKYPWCYIGLSLKTKEEDEQDEEINN